MDIDELTRGIIDLIALLKVIKPTVKKYGGSWIRDTIESSERIKQVPDMSKKWEYISQLVDEYDVVSATPEDVEWIASLEKKAYSPVDAIPYLTLKEWYDANPKGFFVIKNIQTGMNVGHIDILPLKPRTMKKFIKGEDLVEKNISGDCLFTADERNKISELYVESLIVDLTGKAQYAALIKLLINIEWLVNELAALGNVERIYAIAASTEGENLMKERGFNIVARKEDRSDKHNMYGVAPKILIKKCKDIKLLKKLGDDDGGDNHFSL